MILVLFLEFKILIQQGLSLKMKEINSNIHEETKQSSILKENLVEIKEKYHDICIKFS